MGKSLPYGRWRLDAYKGFKTGAGLYAIHLGHEGRRLLNDTETPFNRNVYRVYTTLTATDVAVRGPYASLTAEYNWSPRSVADVTRYAAVKAVNSGIFTWGGAIGFERSIVRAEAGTYFQRYEYVYYENVSEQADVRAFYGDVRVRLRDWLSARVRYSYEVFDREVHTVTFGLTQAY